MLETVLKRVLLSRFEPLETLMAAHQFIIGCLLVAPSNNNLFVLVNAPELKVALGLVMATFAVVHLACLWFHNWHNSHTGRRAGTMSTFMSYMFLALAKIQGVGMVARYDWTAFLFIAITAAIMHLSLWYRRLTE